jgi:hypothetical protein
MTVSGKVFVFTFFVIAVVGLVGFLAFINTHYVGVDATIVNTSSAYYNAQALANQTINMTVHEGIAAANFDSALPLLIMIFTMATAFMLFLLVTKGKKI